MNNSILFISRLSSVTVGFLVKIGLDLSWSACHRHLRRFWSLDQGRIWKYPPFYFWVSCTSEWAGRRGVCRRRGGGHGRRGRGARPLPPPRGSRGRRRRTWPRAPPPRAPPPSASASAPLGSPPRGAAGPASHCKTLHPINPNFTLQRHAENCCHISWFCEL